ncbi:MAG: UDP-glucose 4-epimerase, partial [Clostridiales bacterium]|nr:UDP-glucose 4-epimerase [Clostridiales bacterium]
ISALNYILDSKGVDAFNLGTGTGYSVLDVVHAFERASEKEIPYEIVDRRSGDLAMYYADPSKAHKVLGWSAEKSIEDMCRDSWRWQERNPDGM